MICITGDIHGETKYVTQLCERYAPSPTDCVILLGDVGVNYHCDLRDRRRKEELAACGVPILCIHGNHEQRPAGLGPYSLKEWNGGQVWVEEDFPQLLFTKDGEIYTIDGYRFIAIGGAYSIDKLYRISNRIGWWPDEQPSVEIKEYTERQLAAHRIDYVLSHTCPFRYEPKERMLPGFDRSRIDDSTERWLDTIEASTDYKGWYCGHWHTDKRIDKMHFLYHGVECLPGSGKEDQL